MFVFLFVLLLLTKQRDKKENETQDFSFLSLSLMNHSVASVFSLMEEAVIVVDRCLLPD